MTLRLPPKRFGKPVATLTEFMLLNCHSLQAGARIAGWKCDAKCGAKTRRARDAYVARMFLYDAVSHGQSQAGAATHAFSSKEWIIDLRDISGSYTNAV